MLMHFITRLLADTSGLGTAYVPILAVAGVGMIDAFLLMGPASM